MAWGGPTSPSPKLGPNTDFFLKVRELWLKKDHKELLPYLDQRVRIKLGRTSRAYPEMYAGAQVAGILKKHFSEIYIVKFEYIAEKMEETRGVASYGYQTLDNGVQNSTLLYIHLQLKIGPNQEKSWVISMIHEVEL